MAPIITNSGNWSDSSNWDGGDIGDDITEDVEMNNNTGTITIQNGESYTIAELDMRNGNTLTIDAGGSLTLGDSTNINNNLVTGNSTVINVDGDLEIWGDLDVNNDLILNVTGTLIIHGDINMGNLASLDIQGDVTIDGTFNAGNDANVNVDGTLDVGEDINVGNGSVLTGSGTVTFGGDCNDNGGTFCESGPLPIELLFFKAEVINNQVRLNWATASEENFDFFSIERSEDGQEFYEIDKVQGNGFSDIIINYEYLDSSPVPGRSFYRLKAVDFDGSFEYFEIKSVTIDTFGVEIYPNPLNNYYYNVWINLDNNLPAQLKVFDTQGKLISNYHLTSGLNQLDLLGHPPGVYLVVVYSGALEYRDKLILQ